MKHPAHTYLFLVNYLIWGLIAAAAGVTGLWVWLAGLSVDLSRTAPVLGVCVLFAIIAFIYRCVRRDDDVYLMAHAATQWIAAAGVLGLLSYVSARLNLPLTDEALILIDRLLFFDWQEYVAWVDTHPPAARLFTLAYLSSGPQILALMILLFLAGRIAHMQKFLLAFFVTGLLTVFFAALWPAVGAYVHYDIDVATAYQHVRPAAARVHEAPLLAMRGHSMQTLAFPLQGLVTFPSFHSALSIVLIYAAWPLLRLRYPILLLNILVLFATPVDGGHYLIDIIGGLALAFFSIYMIERWIRLPS